MTQNRGSVLLSEMLSKTVARSHPIFSLFDLCNLARPSRQQLSCYYSIIAYMALKSYTVS